MTGRIILLFDFELAATHWLQTELEGLGARVIALDIPGYDIRWLEQKSGRIRLYSRYARLALDAVRKSTSDDVIVSWTFTTGLATSLLSRLLRKRRNVLALNLIIHPGRPAIDQLKTAIFRSALGSGRMIATTNAAAYVDDYERKLGLHGKEALWAVSDPFNRDTEFVPPRAESEPFCFAGGDAARDWGTLLAAAAECPEIRFKVIARRIRWDGSLRIPSNVDVSFDAPVAEFYSQLKRARLVLLPLSSGSTAGLIVLIKSVAAGKTVLVTNTPATSAYVPQGCEDSLVPMGDTGALAAAIRLYWTDDALRLETAQRLQAHVRANFTPRGYATRILEILRAGGFATDTARQPPRGEPSPEP